MIFESVIVSQSLNYNTKSWPAGLHSQWLYLWKAQILEPPAGHKTRLQLYENGSGSISGPGRLGHFERFYSAANHRYRMLYLLARNKYNIGRGVVTIL